MIRIIFLIILPFISFNSWGSLYPVLSDIKLNKVTPTFTEIFFTQSLVDIGPAGDIVIPTRQYDLYMGLGSVWGDIGTYTFYHEKNPTLVKKGDTYSVAALRAYNNGHSKITRLTNSQVSIGSCAGYAAVAPEIHNNWINGSYSPVGLCVKLPPPGDWCKMTTPALVLDHGRLSLEETEGHSASDKLNIQCTTGTSITLRLMNKEKHVLLSGSARSDIFVNGKSIGETVDLKAGNNVLTISDKLTGITEPGELNGIAVLVIEPV